MEKEREDKILEAIGRQSGDIRAVVEQNKTIIKKLGEHDGRLDRMDERFDQMDGRFDRIESAVLENSKDIRANTTLIKEVAVKLDRVERNVDIAVTNHESGIRRLEQKVGI